MRCDLTGPLSLHRIPIGITAFLAALTGPLSRIVDPKYLILSGEALSAGMTVLLAFADRPERYWPYIFPGLVLGTVGMMATYTHTNIAIFRGVPPTQAGTVGAIFNGALQLGSAVGIAVVGSITSSVDARTGGGGERRFEGRAAAYWFLFAIVVVEWIALLVFYKVRKEDSEEAGQEEGKSSEAGAVEEKAPSMKGDAETGEVPVLNGDNRV